MKRTKGEVVPIRRRKGGPLSLCVARRTETKRGQIADWFFTQIDEAETVAGAGPNIAPPDPLLLAARRGCDRSSRAEAERLDALFSQIPPRRWTA
jgi:hypothetical protein